MITMGFPHDFIRETSSFVYGTAGELVDERVAGKAGRICNP